MPTIGERISRNHDPERYDLVVRIRTQTLQRHILQLGITHFGFEAEKFAPQYEHLRTFDTAIFLTSYFYDLVSEITEAEFCELLTTDTGVQELQELARNKATLLESRDRNDELTALGRWMMNDPEILSWLQKSNMTSWKMVNRQWGTEVNEFSETAKLWYLLLNPTSPYRTAVLNETGFLDFQRMGQAGRVLLMDYLKQQIQPENLVRLMELILQHESTVISWSDRFSVLDTMSDITGFRHGGFGKYEHALAQVYFDEHPEVSNEFLPLYLAYGRVMAYDTRATRSINPVPSSRLVEKSNYQPVDDQESNLDPRSNLLPLIGIEVEAEITPQIPSGFYDVLAKLVVERGTGGSFEYSARPVRQAETLKLLYQKLFEAGFIDLFKTNDYSTHWNANITCHDQFRETLAGLVLTGFLSDGRTTSGIYSGLYSNHSTEGDYFEWKQGDLYHPEQLMLGIDLFHALVTAQKNFEDMATRISVKKGIPKRVVLEDLDKAEFLKEAANSVEQQTLAEIYLDYRTKMRQVFSTATQLDMATLNNFIYGDRTGMQATFAILELVYPETESVLEHDPATFQPKTKSNKARKETIANEIVAAAQAIAYETMHRVQKVLADCYFNYLNTLVSVAQSLAEDTSIEQIEDAQAQLQPVGTDLMKQGRRAFKPRAYDLLQRLNYGMRQTALDDAQKTLIYAAYGKVNSFLVDFKKSQRSGK